MTRRYALVTCGLLSAALLMLRPAPAAAWGKDGHVIVARIAELNLNANARAAIRDLIGDRSIADDRIANWADLIRGSATYRKKYPNNSSWHFVDIPFDAAGFDPERDCKDGNCVVSRIGSFLSVLKDENATADDRKEALFFVVHFVGDIHQPLHCAQRNGDRGGNLLKVTYRGESDAHLNLHSVWDTNLVQDSMGDLTPLDYAQRLSLATTAAQQKEWAQGDAKAWAEASHQLAVDKAYRSAKGAELPKDQADLDDAYADINKKVVEGQLQRAGVRLARLLNEAFP
jgi:hypothetical protein